MLCSYLSPGIRLVSGLADVQKQLLRMCRPLRATSQNVLTHSSYTSRLCCFSFLSCSLLLSPEFYLPEPMIHLEFFTSPSPTRLVRGPHIHFFYQCSFLPLVFCSQAAGLRSGPHLSGTHGSPHLFCRCRQQRAQLKYQ